ncbi:MAG: 50S ribosomal protein L11 methyltransferase [Chitinophagaceae bacterium]
MADYTEYRINVTDNAVKEILIARLSDAGATGFEEEKNVLKAFAPEESQSQLQFEKIIEENGLIFLKSLIKERNWNAEWESDFKPVTIGDFCIIRADFHAPGTGVKHDIIITPKMSFGTGHHATTCLMIKAMENLDFTAKHVFDFGTGTGILSILAKKCGAYTITAIDNDEWSINNSIDNFNLNDCHNILLLKDEGFFSESKYDIILANINRNIVLQNLAPIKQHLSAHGVVLLSGLLTGDEPVIIAEALRYHLKLQEKSELSGWICLRMVNG